jgi:hypothetical protein
MPNAEKSFKKILELLSGEGIIYLTAPNKLWPYEHHYNLYFLSWLPLPVANFYVRLFRRGKSYEDSAYSRTYFGMKKLFDHLPCAYDFILPQNPGSSYFGCGKKSGSYRSLKNIGIFLIEKLPFFWILSKGFILVVRRNSV